MTKYRQKDIRNLVKSGIAIDITTNHSEDAIPERYELIGLSHGIYGINGKVYRGESGQIYAVTKATSALYRW